MKRVLYLALVAVFGCHPPAVRENLARGHLIVPKEQTPDVDWSEAERNSPVAVRNLRRSEQASFHLLRIAGTQAAQVHERSDMVVMTVAGEVELTLNERSVKLVPGDVVEIPRGTPYALKSASPEAGIMYLVHTPPLAADDQQTVQTMRRTDAWQWNVWPQ